MELIPGKPHPEYLNKIVSFSRGKLVDRTIVCSANRHGDVMLIGPRHWDDTMSLRWDAVEGVFDGEFKDPRQFEEGFIDQFGNFATRKEAWQIVFDNAQVLHGSLDFDSYKELYSEHLY